MADDELRLLCVHAHPDDESSKGAPTVARYHDEGVATVLICCTGGEAGDILNPAMDLPEVRASLPDVRREELACAAAIIGYDYVEMLGYQDSGMAGTEANDNPDCFAKADKDEATGKLVTHIRRYRPHVVVTYGDEQEFYPHPDHLRVHEVTIAALDAAADKTKYPDAGEPWQVLKLYYSVFSMRKLRAIHDMLLNLGVESPFPQDWSQFPDNDAQITTRIDVADWMEKRTEALRAHATQIDPNSPMWFGMPPDLEREISGEDDYVLAKSLVETSLPEDDLFAGLR